MLFLLGYIEENAMNNTEDILQAILIGLVVATFLLNTGRVRKATEVCKECLIFLNNTVLKTEGEISNSLHIGIYQTIFRAYCLIPDHTKAEIYGRKLLFFFFFIYLFIFLIYFKPFIYTVTILHSQNRLKKY